MVSLALEELPPLLGRGLNDRVVIACKRYIGTVGLEEVLVDVKAGSEGFECGFQPLYRVLLFRVVKTFIVHAWDTQNHAHVAALGEKAGLIPEAVQVDMVV